MKLLKIGASWCPICKIMMPILSEIEKENSWLETETVTIDENPETMKKYQLHELPTFIFLNKTGVEISRLSGEIKKENLLKVINNNKNK